MTTDKVSDYEECPKCGEEAFSAFRGRCYECYYDEITGYPGNYVS